MIEHNSTKLIVITFKYLWLNTEMLIQVSGIYFSLMIYFRNPASSVSLITL